MTKEKLDQCEPGDGFRKNDRGEVSDNPEWTEEDITQAKPFAEAFPALAEGVRHVRGSHLSHRLLAIGKDCAARLKEPYRSADHGDLLYGEDGLPR